MMSMDPHSYTDLNQGQIKHIDFNFQVDFEKKRILAQNTYTFENAISGPLYLDCRDIEIKEVRQSDKILNWAFDMQDPVKGQRLHIENVENNTSIIIECIVNANASALQWLDPEQTAGKKHPFLFSQCQAIHARSVFPCQDTPSVRFTYEARVDVPAPLNAVMSADRVKIEDIDNRNICHFSMPQAIPSYLFALGVGNITSSDIGQRSRIYAEPEAVEAAAWEFADTEKMIDEAEKLFGPYVWDRFDMLLMPPSFPYGGMENPRLTFLTPTLIVGDRSMANVVSHELAHSWTGNLVTNATWEDFWLNEGWTVYAERRILEALEGKEYANLHGALRRNSMFKDMEIFGMSSDPTCLKFKQEGIDPDDVFSTIPYEKGFAFLNRVEEEVGRERFNPFIREYIQTFKFKSISTETFLDFLNDHFPGIKRTIDISKWIYGPGFPDDAVPIKSSLMDDVFSAVNHFKSTNEFTTDKISQWRSEQKILFLQSLPKEMSHNALETLAGILGVGETGNYSILMEYYLIAIRNGLESVFAGVENILASVGRMLYLKPLYRALLDAKWSEDKVRTIFDKYRNQYHPIAAAGLESILEKAGK